MVVKEELELALKTIELATAPEDVSMTDSLTWIRKKSSRTTRLQI